MKSLDDCRLYCFVDTAYLRGLEPGEVARQLCAGGADLIQLRAKNFPVGKIREMAEILLPITRSAGVGLVINDHPGVARDIGADGCHLGQEDFFGAGHNHVSTIKAGNPGLQIGLSTHSTEQARRAVEAAADYIAIGPVYATGTKPTAAPVTLDYVRWAAAELTLPWFAIGGITLANLNDVLAAGARRICVVSAILTATDIEAACAQFRRRLG